MSGSIKSQTEERQRNNRGHRQRHQAFDYHHQQVELTDDPHRRTSPTSTGWQNDYDQHLNFNCPSGQSISSIRSEHHNFFEDRRWDFDCKPTNKAVNCYWSPYVNSFDQPFTFECPQHRTIAGMSSYHDNYYEDRQWKFYCCESKCISGNCQWTSYVNSFDEYIFWTVPPNSVLVGAESYHHNFQEDRRWKYKYCVQQSC